MDTWRCFDNNTMSMWLHIDFISTLKQLCLFKGMQLYKTINSVKSIFRGFWVMVQSSYSVVEKVLENTYFVFCILYNAFNDCFSLILIVKNILIVSHSRSWVLQCTTPQSKDLLKIINGNLALTTESSFACSWNQKGIYIPNWWILAVF